jgi:hypothetical protein
VTRRHPLLRALSAWSLALYVGAGVGAPVVDAIVFHVGTADGPALHELCQLGQHTSPSVTPTVERPAVEVPSAFDRSPEYPTATLAGVQVSGLPLSRAPPRA